jgi:hypothetical protein
MSDPQIQNPCSAGILPACCCCLLAAAACLLLLPACCCCLLAAAACLLLLPAALERICQIFVSQSAKEL